MPRASSWTGFWDKALPSVDGKFMAIYCPQFLGNPVDTFGVNFTSQSTTGMGHDIANNGPAVGAIERQMYFANCLRRSGLYFLQRIRLFPNAGLLPGFGALLFQFRRSVQR